MDTTKYIEVTHLCKQYKVTEQLFSQLNDTGLVHVTVVEEKPCVPSQSIHKVDKIMRLHQELEVNPEGIDVILNLLEKVENLTQEVTRLRRKIHIYED